MNAEDPNSPSEKTDITNKNGTSILRGTDESMKTTRRKKRKIRDRACKRRKSDQVSPEIVAQVSEGKEVFPHSEKQRGNKRCRRRRFRRMLLRAKEQRHYKCAEKGISALEQLRKFSLKDKTIASRSPGFSIPTILHRIPNWKSLHAVVGTKCNDEKERTLKEVMEIDSAQ